MSFPIALPRFCKLEESRIKLKLNSITFVYIFQLIQGDLCPRVAKNGSKSSPLFDLGGHAITPKRYRIVLNIYLFIHLFIDFKTRITVACLNRPLRKVKQCYRTTNATMLRKQRPLKYFINASNFVVGFGIIKNLKT